LIHLFKTGQKRKSGVAERDGNLALTQNPKLKTQDSKLADLDFLSSCSIISGAKQDRDAHD